jgi:hypothetical protein
MADMTTQVLIEIRDEVRKTNERLGETNERLTRLERRQVETEVRLATELVAVVGAVHEVRDELLEDRRLAAQVTDHERRIVALETGVPRS